jgi:methionine-rich copper-binding protein CopC
VDGSFSLAQSGSGFVALRRCLFETLFFGNGRGMGCSTSTGLPGWARRRLTTMRDYLLVSGPRPNRTLARIVRAFGLLFVGWLFFVAATPASAHANLVRSEPAANSAQTVAPAVVRLWFSEAVEPSFSSVHVVDKSGTAVDKGDSRGMDGDAQGLQVSVNALPDGLYTVVWKNASAVDGHVLAGSFSFKIGRAHV